MNQTLSRWLACGACAAGSVVLAQAPARPPAATLLPVRAVDPPEPTVARGAPPAPGYQFQAPTAVPAPGAQYRPPAQPQPQPQSQQPPAKQPSLWGGVKATFAPKPGEQQPESQPWWPAGAQQPAPPPPAPPQGVYAGPPAYRWYGYGSPTTGANPYAPTGRYPQASGTWFTQTGATPGAFPVPVGGMPVTPRETPVVVQAIPQEPPTTHPGVTRPAAPRFVPPVMEPPPTRAVMAETPGTRGRAEPLMPSGAGVPIAVDPNRPEVNWLPATANSRVPIASTPAAEPPAKQLPVPTAPAQPAGEPQTDWGPSRQSVPADAPLPAIPSLPNATISRGQAPPPAKAVAKTDADIDTLIRSACFGRASRVGVGRPGPQRLHVTLVVPTEADARDAAAVVSRLAELKAYEMTFEAVIGK